MAVCPFASWRPIPANAKQPAIKPRAFIIHAPVDSDKTTSLRDWFISQANETHFYITRLGGLEQYVDTEIRADAQWSANSFAVSVEVWDGRASHPDKPTPPMTPNQMAVLLKLTDWLCRTHGMPRHLCESATGSGIGWHEMYPQWNKGRHDCPGPAREDQIVHELMPALIRLGQASTPPTEPPVEDEEMITLAGTGSAPTDGSGINPNSYYACQWPYRQLLSPPALGMYQALGVKDLGLNDQWVSLHTVEVAQVGLSGFGSGT